MDNRNSKGGVRAMNFMDMTPEERALYEKIKARDESLNWLIANLAIFTLVFTIATLLVLFM